MSIVRFYLIDYAAARRLDFVWGWGSRLGKIGRENCINYSTPFKEGSFIVNAILKSFYPPHSRGTL